MICALNPFIWDKSNLRLPCINAHGVKVKGVDGGRGGGLMEILTGEDYFC